MIPKYEPKPNREWYTLGGLSIELNHYSGKVGIEKNCHLIALDFSEVADLVQFLAWAVRTRMEVTADEENTEVQKQGGDSERREV